MFQGIYKDLPLESSDLQLRFLQLQSDASSSCTGSEIDDRCTNSDKSDHSSAPHCRMIKASLDDLPHYYAVSYTWGDPKEREQIFVNGERLSVPINPTRLFAISTATARTHCRRSISG